MQDAANVPRALALDKVGREPAHKTSDSRAAIILCMSLFRLGLGFYCSTKSLLLPRQTLQERSPKLRVGPLCQNVCSSNLSELLDAVVAQITCQNFWVTEFALVTWLNVSPSLELEWELDSTLNENALVLVRPCF